MGHQISRQDAHFYLHTSDGQHYPLNQQVRTPHLNSSDESNRGALVVGRFGLDAQQLVSSLGIRGNAQQSALAPNAGNGSGLGIASGFQARSQ